MIIPCTLYLFIRCSNPCSTSFRSSLSISIPRSAVGTLSREPDGAFNEDYCKWCYHDGTFPYKSKEQLIDFCVEHMATEAWPKEQVRAHMEAVVPLLKHWK